MIKTVVLSLVAWNKINNYEKSPTSNIDRKANRQMSFTVKHVDMVIAANNYAGHILLLSNIGPAYTTELLYKITRMDILTQG